MSVHYISKEGFPFRTNMEKLDMSTIQGTVEEPKSLQYLTGDGFNHRKVKTPLANVNPYPSGSIVLGFTTFLQISVEISTIWVTENSSYIH